MHHESFPPAFGKVKGFPLLHLGHLGVPVCVCCLCLVLCVVCVGIRSIYFGHQSSTNLSAYRVHPLRLVTHRSKVTEEASCKHCHVRKLLSATTGVYLFFLQLPPVMLGFRSVVENRATNQNMTHCTAPVNHQQPRPPRRHAGVLTITAQ